MGSVYGGTQADGAKKAGGCYRCRYWRACSVWHHKLIGAGSKLAGMAADKGKQLADEYLANNTQNIYNTVKVTLETKELISRNWEQTFRMIYVIRGKSDGKRRIT